jgi:hypothetical protein
LATALLGLKSRTLFISSQNVKEGLKVASENFYQRAAFEKLSRER